MPDARTHDQITIASGVALVPLAYTVQLGRGVESSAALGYTALLVGAHLLSGIMFSPDLDLDSRIDDRWGIFYWIWWPYTWAVPHRHRWLSHGLIISQILRLVYFYLVVIGLLAGLAWLLGMIGLLIPNYPIQLSIWLLNLLRNYPRESLAFIIGFCSGGAAHTIADWLVTGGKRYLRSLGLRVTRDYRDHDRWRPRAERRRARYG
jgi:uncharacterized metal-binding protein